MALKANAIRESLFAKRWICKNAYRRMKRDAKRAVARLRRRRGEGKPLTKGWL